MMISFSATDTQKTTNRDSRTKRYFSWWKQLIRPAQALQTDGERDRARFLASITLGAIFFHLLMIGITLFKPDIEAGLPALILSLITVCVSYGLSRTPYYQYGVRAVVALATAWAFGMLSLQPDQRFIIFTVLPVFIISLFYKALYVLLGGGLVLTSFILLLDIRLTTLDEEIDVLLIIAITLMLAVITALRQYNRALRDERTQNLMQSEVRFRTIFEVSMSAFYLMECIRNANNEIEDFIFLDANQKGLDMVKMSRDQMVGQRFLSISPVKTRQYFFERYKYVVETGIGHEEEFFVDSERGTTGWYSHQVVKINDGIAISTMDITSRKEREQTQNQILMEKRQMEMLRNFVSEFSHDLLTPITILRTSLYLLSKDSDPEMREVRIDKLNTQLTKLEKMIRDMLMLSRLDSPLTEEFTFEPYNLNDILSTLIVDYQQLAVNRQQSIHFQPEAALPLVPLDIHTMPRALGNLIDNALKYTPENGTVFVSTQYEADSAVINIRDTGSGIDPEHLPHIFDRFYREDKHRKSVSGTGLGLAIVYKIIQGHKGTIDVSSTVGKGTTFKIVLPVTTPSDA